MMNKETNNISTDVELADIKGTRKEFVRIYAQACGDLSQKRAQELVDNFFYVLEIFLTNGEKRMSFVGIGTFYISKRKARKYRHPNNPLEIIEVPDKLTIKFKPGKNFKERVVESIEAK